MLVIFGYKISWDLCIKINKNIIQKYYELNNNLVNDNFIMDEILKWSKHHVFITNK